MSAPFAAGTIVYAKDPARLARFYAAVTDLAPVHEAGDHLILESEDVELVIVAIPADIAARIVIATPPERREATAFKPVFWVDDLAATRAAAAAAGGALLGPEKEWDFQGARVCDGHDPEGNIVQFRQAAGD